MPLEFIPNQPIIFEKPIGDYPCLNNDTKTYGQLMQDNDELCIQWKLSPCNEPMCEPNMVIDPIGPDELGTWTAGGGWSIASSSQIAFDGTGNLGGLCDQTVAGFTAGAAYIFEIDATTYTGLVTYEVIIDLQTVYIIDRAGVHIIGFIAPDTSFGIVFNPVGTSTAGDQFVGEGMTLKQYTACWLDNFNGGLPSWSYSYDGYGKFCSTDPSGGDLINTNAISTSGNYSGVELTISNCTQGGLEIILGSTTLGSTSGNGIFRLYGTPSAGTSLILKKNANFDGCVSQVSVYDYGVINDYKFYFKTDDLTTTSSVYVPTPYEDRLVWCNRLSDLTWTINSVPDAALTCQLLRAYVYDPCDAQEYQSVNYINYNATGWECTKVVESWSDGYAFGFYFGNINSPNFRLIQRLRFLAFNPVYKNGGEEYLYSSGNTGRSFAQSQKARTAWFDYMDEYAHDCTRTQLLSQKLLIDGYAFYYPTEDYEPEWNERGAYNLAQSRVKIYHEEAIFGSNCGTMANTVCPPKVIPAPSIQLTQVIVSVNNLDISFIDKTAVNYLDAFWDISGNNIGGVSGGTFDLTNAIDRATILTSIENAINYNYGTTTVSSLFTLVGDILTINVICTGTINLPIKGISLVIFSNGFSPLPLPVTFA